MVILKAKTASVSLRHADLQAAVHDGVLTPAQAHELWVRWSGQVRMQETRPAPLMASDYLAPRASVAWPRFSSTTMLYYVGGVLALGVMTLVMTLG